MTTFDKWVTKKNVLRVSGVAFLILIIGTVYTYLASRYCVSQLTWCNASFTLPDILSELLILNIPVFIFSLASYLLRNEIFKTWILFTMIWIPLSLAYVLSVPNYGGGIGLQITERGVVSVMMPIYYTAASLVIILAQLVRVYWLKKK